MDFKSMKRRELQALCKKHGIPASSTNSQMAEALASLFEVHEKVKPKGCLKNTGKGQGILKRVNFCLEDQTFEFEKSMLEKRRFTRSSSVAFDAESHKGSHNESLGAKLDVPVRVTRSRALPTVVVWPPAVGKKRGRKRLEGVRQNEELASAAVQPCDDLEENKEKMSCEFEPKIRFLRNRVVVVAGSKASDGKQRTKRNQSKNACVKAEDSNAASVRGKSGEEKLVDGSKPKSNRKGNAFKEEKDNIIASFHGRSGECVPGDGNKEPKGNRLRNVCEKEEDNIAVSLRENLAEDEVPRNEILGKRSHGSKTREFSFDEAAGPNKLLPRRSKHKLSKHLICDAASGKLVSEHAVEADENFEATSVENFVEHNKIPLCKEPLLRRSKHVHSKPLTNDKSENIETIESDTRPIKEVKEAFQMTCPSRRSTRNTMKCIALESKIVSTVEEKSDDQSEKGGRKQVEKQMRNNARKRKAPDVSMADCEVDNGTAAVEIHEESKNLSEFKVPLRRSTRNSSKHNALEHGTMLVMPEKIIEGKETARRTRWKKRDGKNGYAENPASSETEFISSTVTVQGELQNVTQCEVAPRHSRCNTRTLCAVQCDDGEVIKNLKLQSNTLSKGHGLELSTLGCEAGIQSEALEIPNQNGVLPRQSALPGSSNKAYTAAVSKFVPCEVVIEKKRGKKWSRKAVLDENASVANSVCDAKKMVGVCQDWQDQRCFNSAEQLVSSGSPQVSNVQSLDVSPGSPDKHADDKVSEQRQSTQLGDQKNILVHDDPLEESGLAEAGFDSNFIEPQFSDLDTAYRDELYLSTSPVVPDSAVTVAQGVGYPNEEATLYVEQMTETVMVDGCDEDKHMGLVGTEEVSPETRNVRHSPSILMAVNTGMIVVPLGENDLKHKEASKLVGCVSLTCSESKNLFSASCNKISSGFGRDELTSVSDVHSASEVGSYFVGCVNGGPDDIYSGDASRQESVSQNDMQTSNAAQEMMLVSQSEPKEFGAVTECKETPSKMNNIHFSMRVLEESNENSVPQDLLVASDKENSESGHCTDGNIVEVTRSMLRKDKVFDQSPCGHAQEPHIEMSSVGISGVDLHVIGSSSESNTEIADKVFENGQTLTTEFVETVAAETQSALEVLDYINAKKHIVAEVRSYEGNRDPIMLSVGSMLEQQGEDLNIATKGNESPRLLVYATYKLMEVTSEEHGYFNVEVDVELESNLQATSKELEENHEDANLINVEISTIELQSKPQEGDMVSSVFPKRENNHGRFVDRCEGESRSIGATDIFCGDFPDTEIKEYAEQVKIHGERETDSVNSHSPVFSNETFDPNAESLQSLQNDQKNKIDSLSAPKLGDLGRGNEEDFVQDHGFQAREPSLKGCGESSITACIAVNREEVDVEANICLADDHNPAGLRHSIVTTNNLVGEKENEVLSGKSMKGSLDLISSVSCNMQQHSIMKSMAADNVPEEPKYLKVNTATTEEGNSLSAAAEEMHEVHTNFVPSVGSQKAEQTDKYECRIQLVDIDEVTTDNFDTFSTDFRKKRVNLAESDVRSEFQIKESAEKEDNSTFSDGCVGEIAQHVPVFLLGHYDLSKEPHSSEIPSDLSSETSYRFVSAGEKRNKLLLIQNVDSPSAIQGTKQGDQSFTSNILVTETKETSFSARRSPKKLFHSASAEGKNEAGTKLEGSLNFCPCEDIEEEEFIMSNGKAKSEGDVQAVYVSRANISDDKDKIVLVPSNTDMAPCISCMDQSRNMGVFSVKDHSERKIIDIESTNNHKSEREISGFECSTELLIPDSTDDGTTLVKHNCGETLDVALLSKNKIQDKVRHMEARRVVLGCINPREVEVNNHSVCCMDVNDRQLISGVYKDLKKIGDAVGCQNENNVVTKTMMDEVVCNADAMKSDKRVATSSKLDGTPVLCQSVSFLSAELVCCDSKQGSIVQDVGQAGPWEIHSKKSNTTTPCSTRTNVSEIEGSECREALTIAQDGLDNLSLLIRTDVNMAIVDADSAIFSVKAQTKGETMVRRGDNYADSINEVPSFEEAEEIATTLENVPEVSFYEASDRNVYEDSLMCEHLGSSEPEVDRFDFEGAEEQDSVKADSNTVVPKVHEQAQQKYNYDENLVDLSLTVQAELTGDEFMVQEVVSQDLQLVVESKVDETLYDSDIDKLEDKAAITGGLQESNSVLCELAVSGEQVSSQKDNCTESSDLESTGEFDSNVKDSFTKSLCYDSQKNAGIGSSVKIVYSEREIVESESENTPTTSADLARLNLEDSIGVNFNSKVTSEGCQLDSSKVFALEEKPQGFGWLREVTKFKEASRESIGRCDQDLLEEISCKFRNFNISSARKYSKTRATTAPMKFPSNLGYQPRISLEITNKENTPAIEVKYSTICTMEKSSLKCSSRQPLQSVEKNSRVQH